MPLNLDNLRRAVAKSGKSQSQLAETLGMKQPNVARILSGAHADLKISTIDKLAAALNVRPALLIESKPARARTSRKL